MSKGLRKITSAVSKSNCIVIFINQLREKVGIMFGQKFKNFNNLSLNMSY